MKKYSIDLMFQVGVGLLAYSLFVDCGGFLAEWVDPFGLSDFEWCQTNYFGFWGVLLVSVAGNLFLRNWRKN